jgi:hypothetical protein
MGVSVSLIACPSKRNLTIPTAIPCEEVNVLENTNAPTHGALIPGADE